MTVARLLVLFARAPASEARDKRLPDGPATDFFGAIAQEWLQAARRSGARFAVSAPPGDLPAWRRALPGADEVLWIAQRGGSFGLRLEDTLRRAGRLAREVVVTGGDVVPSPAALSAAFDGLASGADAVIAPAPDGGVSLLSLPADPDLLRSIGRRRRDVFRHLRGRLQLRGRRLAIVPSVADVDGPESLVRVQGPSRIRKLASLVRRACRPAILRNGGTLSIRPAPARSAALLRGPPRAA